MPGTFAQQLIAQYAKPDVYVYSDAIQLKTATSLSDKFKAVKKVEPWTHGKTNGLLVHHPVAWWRSLQVTIVPMPGIYGRMCTFYGGWASSGTRTPETVPEMLALHGAVIMTFGGTGDPGVAQRVIPCVFNDTMADILKTPYNETVRPVYYYAFVEIGLIDKPQDADRFLLHMQGEFEVQGRY